MAYRRPPNCRLSGRVASRRRCRHRWRVVLDLQFVVVRGGLSGEWSLPCIDDGGSHASGSKSKKGDDNSMKGYEAMQTRIANRKKEREKSAAGSKPVKGSNNKRVKKSQLTRSKRQTRHELVRSLAYSHELWRVSSTTRRPVCLNNRTVLRLLPSYLWHPRLPRYTSLAQTRSSIDQAN